MCVKLLFKNLNPDPSPDLHTPQTLILMKLMTIAPRVRGG